jgi:hypothetical protein
MRLRRRIVNNRALQSRPRGGPGAVVSGSSTPWHAQSRRVQRQIARCAATLRRGSGGRRNDRPASCAGPAEVIAQSGRNELQGNAVDAVAEAGRSGAVIEDMSLMAAASSTVDFHPGHEKSGVRPFFHHLGIDRLPEAWPAGAAIELMFRGIGGQVTARAIIGARLVIFVERTRKGPFRIFMPQHLIGRGRQQFFPFVVGSWSPLRFPRFQFWAAWQSPSRRGRTCAPVEQACDPDISDYGRAREADVWEPGTEGPGCSAGALSLTRRSRLPTVRRVRMRARDPD